MVIQMTDDTQTQMQMETEGYRMHEVVVNSFLKSTSPACNYEIFSLFLSKTISDHTHIAVGVVKSVN